MPETDRMFRTLLEEQWDQGKFLCVGLDSDYEKIPERARSGGVGETIAAFNKAMVDATYDIAGAYKINTAFYEAHGDLGWGAMQQTIEYIRERAAGAPVILDAKRADIGNTNNGYVAACFERLAADAVTVHPYLGAEAIQPFLDRTDKGIIVLCRTSNSGAAEFQDLSVEGEPLYLRVARAVAQRWNANGNCALVVGATYPEDMKKIRAVAPDLPFLIPGIGAQGGDIEQTIACGKDSRGRGMIINVSRGIIFASSGEDFAEAARAKAQEFDGAIRKSL
jgi:orotidine-5'-phosphate decarboxylase